MTTRPNVLARAWLLAMIAPLVPLAVAEREATVAIVDGKEIPAPSLADQMGDPATIERILDEGKNRNQVMDHLTELTTTIGARLTGSSSLTRANHWCRDKYEQWGLSNPHLESWGTIPVGFDRGPVSGKVLLRRETQNEDATTTVEFESLRDLVLTNFSWAAGTNLKPDGTCGGPVRAPVLKEPQTDAEYAAVKNKLKGAWILVQAPSPVGQRGIRNLYGVRYDLMKSARKKVAEGAPLSDLSIPERLTFEGVAGYLSTSKDERIWTGSVPGWRELDFDAIPKDVQVSVRGSDYDFINSRLYDKEPIEVEVDAACTFKKGPLPVYNTIAEIKGTELPDEVVIVSGHLDSWDTPGSQGATDNGTGTAVTLEAARILIAANAKPRRTIRFIHWTGEEQGLLGSAEYVKMHADSLDKISAVFVDDGGTNSQGGLHATANMADMLAAASAPINNVFFDDLTNTPLNVNVQIGDKLKSGGSDHSSFIKAGVPGFFWDEVGRADYAHGWHTQFDRLDLAIPAYLKQSATCSALVAYRLACAPTLLPRPPQDEPKPTASR